MPERGHLGPLEQAPADAVDVIARRAHPALTVLLTRGADLSRGYDIATEITAARAGDTTPLLDLLRRHPIPLNLLPVHAGEPDPNYVHAPIWWELVTARMNGELTVEQIAAEAGLSRTAFFRYFGSKEELVLGKMGEFGHEIVTALAARPGDEGHWEALRRSFDVITEPDAREPRSFLDLMRLLDDACAVMTVSGRRPPGRDDLRAQALVASAL
ncbi:TetR/AcrR family transcriptional regulator [Nocardia gipuzkoensis]|uniref:TetR/AcrR family transcriptional regulator n=1 Tax=Nocardia gipuzkoensis TaxID=2749991 RepID=UPI001E38AD32|nr:TetR/AcrR family transcriptional regulator [Nocardia gipuzkoensis]UGT67744.1 TetR/AcrR family transcriptional regulator [Nocardia gipuzkoensis]